MRYLAIVAMCLSFVSARADSITIRSGSYAAIAYSPSTGKYRYAHNYNSRRAAEDAAVTALGADDAKIVCWTSEGFCALALGDDKSAYGVGWRFGAGASNTDAMKEALKNCNARTTNARVVVCLSTDGRYVYRPEVKAVKKEEDSPAKEGAIPKFEPRNKMPREFANDASVDVKWDGKSYLGRVLEYTDAFDMYTVEFHVDGKREVKLFAPAELTRAIINPDPSAAITPPGTLKR
jgi:hypothetical protein